MLKIEAEHVEVPGSQTNIKHGPLTLVRTSRVKITRARATQFSMRPADDARARVICGKFV